MILLTADLHLTDDPRDDYRWDVFPSLCEAAVTHKCQYVYILGDLTDKKTDRHSGELINRLSDALVGLSAHVKSVNIIRGNHDMPLSQPELWRFTNYFSTVRYYTTPTLQGDILLLPFGKAPLDKMLESHQAAKPRVIFMHHTVNGAVVANGEVLEGPSADFPPGVKVYSGDIHVPQDVGAVTYVGAPHPIHFGDDYKCRLLVLDKHYKIADEVVLHPPRKLMLDIRDPKELKRIRVASGEQARVRLHVPAEQIGEVASMEADARAWADKHGVFMASWEVTVQEDDRRPDASKPSALDAQPEYVLDEFCRHENVPEHLAEFGKKLLQDHGACE